MIGIVLPEENPSVDEPGPVKTWVLALSTCLVACSLAIYGTILVTVPPFGELFAELGTTLPVLTRTVIDYSKFTVVLALIGVIPLISMWRYRSSGSPRANRDFKTVIASFGISLIVSGISCVGLYLPVFRMGADMS